MPPPVTHELADERRASTSEGVADAEPTGEIELGHSVELEAFSGPLDLLLFLVRRAEVDVIDIPIATIADQFVDTVAAWNELDLDVAGDFILMAATLLEIKARLIAPPLEAPVDEDAPEEDVVDLRAGLVGKLLAYRRFKEASLDLLAREDHQRHRHIRQLREEIPEDPEEAEGIDLDNADPYALASAWELVLKRINGLGPRTVINDTVPLESRVTEMLKHMRSSGHAFLNAIFASQPNRIARVTTFMALLECVRQRWIEAIQHGQYADVELRFRAEEERAIHEIAFAPEPEAKRRQRRPPLITWEGGPDAMTGDEDGEAPEEPQESDEQRFMRELEETSKVDSVLAWSADIELGFARFQAERRGDPWPPPKPQAPEPVVAIEAPAKPSWMAARAQARKPKEREDKPAVDGVPAAPAAAVEAIVAPVALAVNDAIAAGAPATAPSGFVPEQAVFARAEPEPWVPIAAIAFTVVAAEGATHVDAGTAHARTESPPTTQPVMEAPAVAMAPVTEAVMAPSVEPEPEPIAPAWETPVATPGDAVAPVIEPAAVATVDPIPPAPETPVASATIETPATEPSAEPLLAEKAEPLQAAAFADAVLSVEDRVAVRLDEVPSDDAAAVAVEASASSMRGSEPISAPMDAGEVPDSTPVQDPILAAISDIELDPKVEEPSPVERIAEPIPPPAAVASVPTPSSPVMSASETAPLQPAPAVIPSFEPRRSTAPGPSAVPTVQPHARPSAPVPPPPSVRTAARREPTAIVMSTGRPADSRAQMRAVVASRRLRHRTLALSSTLLVVAAGCWIWSLSTDPAPASGTPGAMDDAGDAAPRVGAIPPLIAAREDAIAIDSARLSTIPRLAAWTERVRLGNAMPDLASWTSALFSDGAVPAIEEHWFVFAPKQPLQTLAPASVPEVLAPAPVAVEPPVSAVVPSTIPARAAVAIASPIETPVGEPLPVDAPVATPAPEQRPADAPVAVAIPSPPVIVTTGTLVRWPADEPTAVSGHAPGLPGWIGRLHASRHADAFAALLSEGVPTGATIPAPAEALPAFRYDREAMMSSSAWMVVWAWDIAP